MVRGGETEIGGQQRGFQQTAWTEILSARGGSDETLRKVLDRLIDLYWKPVYFHVRRKGNGVEDAKDLTQQFFSDFIERASLAAADPSKGKFRTFLLSACNNFLCDQYDRKKAKKRQPDRDYRSAETQFHIDNTFERDWANLVLDRAFAQLRSQSPREARVVEAQRRGKTRYSELATELDTTENNIKAIAHRGRDRLRKIILEELRDTVSRPGEEEEELTALLHALSL